MSIYSLNKDELVYLISTIEKKTREDCEKECKQQFLTALFETYFNKLNVVTEVYVCHVCQNFREIESRTQLKRENTELKFYRCYGCSICYCENHVKENMTYHPNSDFWVCHDPTYHYD